MSKEINLLLYRVEILWLNLHHLMTLAARSAAAGIFGLPIPSLFWMRSWSCSAFGPCAAGPAATGFTSAVFRPTNSPLRRGARSPHGELAPALLRARGCRGDFSAWLFRARGCGNHVAPGLVASPGGKAWSKIPGGITPCAPAPWLRQAESPPCRNARCSIRSNIEPCGPLR